MKKVLVAVLMIALVSSVFAGCKPKAQPVTLTIWHSWSGAELDVLNDAIAKYNQKHPEVTINQLQVPFDQLQNKYQTEAAAGGGPDILVGPADWIGAFTNANLIAPLDSYFDSTFLADYVQGALDQVKFKGHMMAFPESTECVALIYNKSLVPNVPKDTNELITLVDSLSKGDTYGFVYNSGFYFTAGYFFAAGMKLFDDNYNAVVNQGDGGVIALNFLKKLASDPHFIVANDYGKADSMFKEGKAAMIINGPWAVGDYTKALGDKVGVAPMPVLADTGKPFAPFVNTKDFFVNANISETQKKAAIDFIKFMVSPEIEQEFFQKAKHIPSNVKVDTSSDPIISGFLTQMKTGVSMPIAPEMGAVWDPMQTAIDSVLAGKASPQDAINTAQKTIQDKINAMRGQ
ncbi:sugar ABC transporter substrate-binding protein [Caldisericum exile]|uniref:ABC transporter substrate binding protein n=1 Tax=Caldisericum exile (strain DSM 21853 / NBRC 104410 / AZM16c01) TaxID=511051 RepID=A0A7U6JE99_CALEA|nr:maltose ABC transporter substrate-binding protein [Caldisericum exile]BAL80511.1 putative ABC transporter substrate binding protein [Caldisericum exile AZM16c01]